MINQELNRALALATRNNRTVSLLSLELDNFKRINDTLGLPIGDQLLREIATRLIRCVRSSDIISVEDYDAQFDHDTIARLRGDEFLIVLNEVSSAEESAVVARRIRETIREPIEAGVKKSSLPRASELARFPRTVRQRNNSLLRPPQQ